MNQTSQALELQIVDLGDAKAQTLGTPAEVHTEDNPTVQAKH